MSKMFIYEPAMCCDTGLCGVGVDPELLRISTVVSSLKNKGITIKRYNLTSTPSEFVKNQEINTLINNEGIEVLPVTVVNNAIVKKGAYPTNEELATFLSVSLDTIATSDNTNEETNEETNDSENNDGCDCSGGCCC